MSALAALQGLGQGKRRVALSIAGYSSFFVFCFLTFAYFTFPYDRLSDVIKQRLEAASADGTTTTAQIGDVSPYWLTGVSITDVTLERTAATPNATPTRIELDELTVHASPFSLLLGSPDVSFNLVSGEGEADGNYTSDSEGKERHIDAELDALDLGKLGLGSYLGVPLTGTATGTVQVDLPAEIATSNGAVELTIEGVSIGDGKTPVKLPGMSGGLTLEKIDAGKLEIKLAIKEGVATIETLQADGKDLTFMGSGSLRLASPFDRTRADLTLSFKFDEAYKTRNDRTAMAFQLMSSNPLIQRATAADGMVRMQLSGTITALKPRPATAAPAGSASAKRAAKRGAKATEADEVAEPTEAP